MSDDYPEYLLRKILDFLFGRRLDALCSPYSVDPYAVGMVGFTTRRVKMEQETKQNKHKETRTRL